MIKSIALIFLFPFLANCAGEGEKADDYSSECSAYLKALHNTPAEKLFNQQRAAGNPRFLAVYGYALQFPGLNTLTSKERDKLVDKSGYVVLKGTSDDIPDAGCEQYQQQALEYAAKYNQLFFDDLNSSVEGASSIPAQPPLP